MNKPHKWAKEIKAWADGAEIEEKWGSSRNWEESSSPPQWYDDVEYRIKPQPKEPQYLYVMESGSSYSFLDSPRHPHLKCIGKIKLEQDDE